MAQRLDGPLPQFSVYLPILDNHQSLAGLTFLLPTKIGSEYDGGKYDDGSLEAKPDLKKIEP